MTKDVAQLIKEATEAVKDVPDPLKTIAFEKAFDALSAEHQGVSGDQSASSGGRRKSTFKGAKASTSQAATESNRSLLDQLDRTSHPEITHDGTALTNSLRVLQAARDELDIDGLSASDIAYVLTDKFRCRVTRQAVSMALNAAGQLVNRHKDGSAVIFRIMSRGEKHLDDLDTGKETDSKPTKKRRLASSQAKSAKAKTATTKSTAKGTSRKNNSSQKTGSKQLGPKAVLTGLISEGFFSEPRTIASIISHLKHATGRTYKTTDMSPTLLRLLRENQLVREQNSDNQYEYKNV